MPIDTKEITSAADAIRQMGWVQHSYVNARGVCLVGAHRVARSSVYGAGIHTPEMQYPVRTFQCADEAIWSLLAWRVIREQFPTDAVGVLSQLEASWKKMEDQFPGSELSPETPLSSLVVAWNDEFGTPESALVVAEKADLLYDEMLT